MRLTGRDGGNFFGSHCGWSDKVLGVRSQTHFMRSINANANVHLLLCLYLKISLELTHILSHNTLTQIYDGLKLNYDGFYECFMSDRLDVSVTLLSWCNFWGNLGHTVLTKINISLKKILSRTQLTNETSNAIKIKITSLLLEIFPRSLEFRHVRHYF